MRGADIRRPGALRPRGASAPGDDGSDDARGVRPDVPGDGGRTLRPGDARLDGVVPPAGVPDQPARPVSSGGQRAPGTGGADGGTVRPAGRVEPALGPRFDQPVPNQGYAWWYVDALSDDGRHGITLIAFIGSVFSPYYAWARRRGRGDPLHHCAVNAVLYGHGRKRWALTERGWGSARQGESWLTIGPSSLAWDGDALTVRIDEVTAPFPSRLRGIVRLLPAGLGDRSFALDAEGRHLWSPVAPCARVEVALEHPSLRWSGPGYFDTNAGSSPLEDAFGRWDWSRAPLRRGAAVLYDVTRRDGSTLSVALHADPSGQVRDLEPPPKQALPRTRWGVDRATRADIAEHKATVLRTLEDAPFYARSIVSSRVLGEAVTAMHESLALDRFRAGWVQALLPFRMPRRLR